MKKLLFTILIFILVCPAAFTQSINADTLLLIDTNAVAKGKLYYLRVSGDTLFINSDTIVSGGVGDSFWYEYSSNTITTDNKVYLDSSFLMNYGEWKMGYHDPFGYGINYIYFGNFKDSTENVGSFTLIYPTDEGLYHLVEDRIIDDDTVSYHGLTNTSNISWVGNANHAAYLQMYAPKNDSAFFDLHAIEFNNSNSSYISGTPLYMDIRSDSVEYEGRIFNFIGTIGMQPTNVSYHVIPSEGDMYYDSDDDRVKVYTSAGWKSIKWTDD